jgi:hypothetical protein
LINKEFEMMYSLVFQLGNKKASLRRPLNVVLVEVAGRFKSKFSSGPDYSFISQRDGMRLWISPS